MFKHILLPTDGSELAEAGVKYGLALAKETGAKVTIITASEPVTAMMSGGGGIGVAFPYDQLRESMTEAANETLTKAEAIANQQSVAVETIHCADQHPSDAIVQTADEAKCDLIVMASHGRRAITQMLMGSVATAVLARSTAPVLLYR